jgi:hypothetical protein
MVIRIIKNAIYQHKVKQDLKFLVSTRKFRKGIGITDLERIAIYTTI